MRLVSPSHSYSFHLSQKWFTVTLFVSHICPQTVKCNRMHLPALNRKKDALSRPLFKKKNKKNCQFVLCTWNVVLYTSTPSGSFIENMTNEEHWMQLPAFPTHGVFLFLNGKRLFNFIREEIGNESIKTLTLIQWSALIFQHDNTDPVRPPCYDWQWALAEMKY